MIRAEAILEATSILKIAGSGVRYSDPTGEIYEITGNLTAKQITDIEAKADEVLTEWTAQEYARNRAIEYPAIADQLDEIYHNGINAWKAVIKVTKDKYPKG